MISPTTLIFSHSKDEHLPPVLRALGADAEPFLIDLRHFCDSLSGTIVIELNGEDAILRLPCGSIVDLANLKTVWWRRPTSIEVPADCDARFRQFVLSEQTQFFEGLLEVIPPSVRFYNHPDI